MGWIPPPPPPPTPSSKRGNEQRCHVEPDTPWPCPESRTTEYCRDWTHADDDLRQYIKEGDIQAVREYFDDCFWNKRDVNLVWDHLKTALSNNDKKMVTLLLTWKVPLSKDLILLDMRDIKLLKSCGLRISKDFLADIKTEETLEQSEETLEKKINYIEDSKLSGRVMKTEYQAELKLLRQQLEVVKKKIKQKTELKSLEQQLEVVKNKIKQKTKPKPLKKPFVFIKRETTIFIKD